MKALLQQELDTVITEEDSDDYYEANKNVYRLNEELMQLRYIHFSSDLSDKKDLVKLFKSNNPEDLEELIARELEFYSFSFNDSIWVSYRDVEKKLTFLRCTPWKGGISQSQETWLDVEHRNIQISTKTYMLHGPGPMYSACFCILYSCVPGLYTRLPRIKKLLFKAGLLLRGASLIRS